MTDDRLGAIEGQMLVLQKRQNETFIEIGRLLIEVSELVDHGNWLLWLKQHFPKGIRTAQRYMEVARLVAKYDRLTYLRLTKSAFYHLCDSETLLDEDMIQKIESAAESRWLNESDIESILVAPGPDGNADEPPPDPDPPPPAPPPDDESERNREYFVKSLRMLDELVRAPMGAFESLSISDKALRRVRDFLTKILEKREAA